MSWASENIKFQLWFYSKLMNHEWRKLEDKTQQLNVHEIKRKIRKAINDRKSKLQYNQLKRLSNVHHSKKLEMQQRFNKEIEDQLNVELECFAMFGYA